jgi:hypothetical protein
VKGKSQKAKVKGITAARSRLVNRQVTGALIIDRSLI